MGKRVVRLSLSEVVIGDKIYSEFPNDVGELKKGYVPVVRRIDMGSGGIFLGVEHSPHMETVWVRVEDKKACIVREFND